MVQYFQISGLEILMCNVILTPDTKVSLSVKLSLDLQPYCEAYQNRDQAPHVFDQVRYSYLTELSGFSGAVYWDTIKNLLSEQCNQEVPLEKKLFSYLTNKEGTKNPAPLVFDALKHGLIELVKNSSDALLKKHLLDSNVNTLLNMRISVILQDDCISIFILDNSGGFSEAYLHKFAQDQSLLTYREARLPSTDKMEQSVYYFGGRGKGLPFLVNLLLDGVFISQSGEPSIKRFQVEPGETSITIDNHDEGARIILTSPFNSALPCKEKLSGTKESNTQDCPSLNKVETEEYPRLELPLFKKKRANEGVSNNPSGVAFFQNISDKSDPLNDRKLCDDHLGQSYNKIMIINPSLTTVCNDGSKNGSVSTNRSVQLM